MADHHNRHNPLGQDALFTTPASLMLDARLTPLERNGWQVLRMLRSAEGISPLANLGQLRRYLTSTPLGQRAGYETARRVLVVLRLTGWISLVGQHRDPLTRIFHRSRATNEDGIALVCPKIQVSNLDQRAGNAEAKLYRRN